MILTKSNVGLSWVVMIEEGTRRINFLNVIELKLAGTYCTKH